MSGCRLDFELDQEVGLEAITEHGGELVFINETLAGETIGVAETDSGDGIVHFADIDLGIIDRRAMKLRGFRTARPGSAQEKQRKNTVSHVTGP